jgi:arabinofuranan 3-O-arabinosyltransferase
VVSAVLLGVVVAIKPSLAPVLLIPLVQRRAVPLWSGILGAVVATVVGVLAAGPSSALEWLRLASGTPAPEVDANASLPGLVARLGGPGWVGWALTVLVVGASLWWVRRASPETRVGPSGVGPSSVPGSVGPADGALFAVVAGCLLAAPIAWLNYTVLLWPGALVLARAGRWRLAVPLLVVPVVPVAWGNLWQADPHTGWALLGRSLYCLVLLGYWIALLRMSASGGVATSGVNAPLGSPSSHRTPVGGTLSTADAGRPCHGSSVAHTAPKLPTPEPP